MAYGPKRRTSESDPPDQAAQRCGKKFASMLKKDHGLWHKLDRSRQEEANLPCPVAPSCLDSGVQHAQIRRHERPQPPERQTKSNRTTTRACTTSLSVSDVNPVEHIRNDGRRCTRGLYVTETDLLRSSGIRANARSELTIFKAEPGIWMDSVWSVGGGWPWGCKRNSSVA